MLLRDPGLDNVRERGPHRRMVQKSFHPLLIVPSEVVEAAAQELRTGLGRDKRAKVRPVDAQQERAQRDGPCAHEYCERGEQRRVVDLVVAGVQARVSNGGCYLCPLRLAQHE